MEKSLSTSDASLTILQPEANDSPCTGCHSGCCRAFIVPLTGYDMIRIMTNLELPFWEFVCRYADESGEIAKGIAPHFHFDDDPETPFTIGLLQDASTHFPETQKCQFLKEHEKNDEHPLGVANCSIYEDRPMACRLFPARLDEQNEIGIVNIPKFGRAGSNPAYQLCPRDWTTEDIDAEVARRDIGNTATEMQQMHLLAERWNASPRSWLLFPDVIQMVFGNAAQN